MVGLSFGQLNTFWSTEAYGTNCSGGGQHTRLFCFCVSFYTVLRSCDVCVCSPCATPVRWICHWGVRVQPLPVWPVCSEGKDLLHHPHSSVFILFILCIVFIFLFCTLYWLNGELKVWPPYCVLCTVNSPSLVCGTLWLATWLGLLHPSPKFPGNRPKPWADFSCFNKSYYRKSSNRGRPLQAGLYHWSGLAVGGVK